MYSLSRDGDIRLGSRHPTWLGAEQCKPLTEHAESRRISYLKQDLNFLYVRRFLATILNSSLSTRALISWS